MTVDREQACRMLKSLDDNPRLIHLEDAEEVVSTLRGLLAELGQAEREIKSLNVALDATVNRAEQAERDFGRLLDQAENHKRLWMERAEQAERELADERVMHVENVTGMQERLDAAEARLVKADTLADRIAADLLGWGLGQLTDKEALRSIRDYFDV